MSGPATRRLAGSPAEGCRAVEHHRRSRRVDRRLGRFVFVAAQIVEDEAVARTKLRRENLGDIGEELATSIGPSMTKGAMIPSFRPAMKVAVRQRPWGVLAIALVRAGRVRSGGSCWFSPGSRRSTRDGWIKLWLPR